jgi:L-alanine-DL-glutamate epimerase-like enolase superfamily enzyme
VESSSTINGASIASILACTVSIPLDSSTSFSTRNVSARDYTLVKLVGEDGVEGIGFCYAGSRAGSLSTAAVRHLLAPLLQNQDPYCVESLWQEMYQEALLHGRAGSVMRALSALDIAIWDHNARAANLPLYKYLGAFHSESVPAYASGGYYLENKTPEMLGEEMASYVDVGFEAVKMKVGRLDPPEEEKRVAAARESVGPDVSLMLDANNAWADLPTALRFMKRLEKYDPYWIEEPFSPDDIENHARLAKRTPVLVTTGEIEAGRWRHKELLDKHAAAVLQTDAAVCGGITEFRRIAATASSYGVTIAPHWFHDLHVHLVAAIPNGLFVEYFPDDKVLNFRRLINRQLEVHRGNLILPTLTGLGFEFEEEIVAQFSLDGWR